MADKFNKGEEGASVQEPRQTNDQIIPITGIKDGGPELKMPDDGVTKTKPDKKLIWHIDTLEVAEITAIIPINNPSLVFSKLPEKVKDSEDWEGKIKNKFDKYTEEKYTIKYKKPKDTTEYVYDPIIQVNPEPLTGA